MKTIGLIGGMSWEASIEYYRIINQEVKARLGGAHSAKSLMFSVDFGEIAPLQSAGEWDMLAVHMVDAAQRLACGGADCLLLCANTMHRCAPAIEAAVSLPLLHIADTAGCSIQEAGLRRVGLLGTRYTMEGDFISGRLADRFGLDLLIPDTEQRMMVHHVIYDELILGVIREESRRAYQQIIESLVERGADGIVLGCTELPLLVKPEDSPVPLFDTTRLHALAAVDFALAPIEASQ